MLSCDVIIWDDNTPLFCFSWKLHSLQSDSNSVILPSTNLILLSSSAPIYFAHIQRMSRYNKLHFWYFTLCAGAQLSFSWCRFNFSFLQHGNEHGNGENSIFNRPYWNFRFYLNDISTTELQFKVYYHIQLTFNGTPSNADFPNPLHFTKCQTFLCPGHFFL